MPVRLVDRGNKNVYIFTKEPYFKSRGMALIFKQEKFTMRNMRGAHFLIKNTGGLLAYEIRCQINKFKQDRRLSG